MLLEGGAHLARGIPMERQETLGQVCQPEPALAERGFEQLAQLFGSGIRQHVGQRQIVELRLEPARRLRGGGIARVERLREIAEHAGGRTRGRHELAQPSGAGGRAPRLLELGIGQIELPDAVSNGARSDQVGGWRWIAQQGQLAFCFAQRQPVSLEGLSIALFEGARGIAHVGVSVGLIREGAR